MCEPLALHVHICSYNDCILAAHFLMTISIGLRIPESLRDKLASQASLNQRSLNSEITARLDASLSVDARVARELFDAIALPRVVRMKSSSTSADVMRILNVARHLPVQRLIFAAKPNELNTALLVLIIETPAATFVVDDTWLNMARRPREMEVQELFQGFDRLGLVNDAEYCPDLVEDTAALSPEEAVERIAKTGRIRRLSNPADYLRVLAQHEHFDVSNYRAT